MNRLLRAYARQRLASFRRVEQRQRDEDVRGMGWAACVLVVVAAIVASGILGL